MSRGSFSQSDWFFGTQIRPSLRSDSDISVSFDWWLPVTGMQVGWICV